MERIISLCWIITVSYTHLVIGQTLRYKVEKTTESYRQQLQATAYALGRDIGESELLGYSEATRLSLIHI